MNLLITGGCGFVGASQALNFKQQNPSWRITCLDNLKRRGSELNIARLKSAGITFLHGDIRNPEDLEAAGPTNLVLECSAEPSVLAGYGESPRYLLDTNLGGTINCLEYARRHKAAMIFLSTSRVYPMGTINDLPFRETETRFELADEQHVTGVSDRGFSEAFPLDGPRSLYGTTKLASELLIQEYVHMYGLQAVINRCGVLTGPWQFGKVDQGVVVLWAARHFFRQSLSYIGFGGLGKQVRDILHVDDLFQLLSLQIQNLERHNGQIYNVGGGRAGSLSLQELTGLCGKHTTNQIDIAADPKDRPADIRLYLSDTEKVRKATGWQPQIGPEAIIEEITSWISENETDLQPILS
ncbi:MAG: NAD-dependent epimerase/dehydratase family protein [bacterium]|nr:NAD-dependent epimerase/dehydratase family protein [bacterium]